MDTGVKFKIAAIIKINNLPLTRHERNAANIVFMVSCVANM